LKKGNWSLEIQDMLKMLHLPMSRYPKKSKFYQVNGAKMRGNALSNSHIYK
jgi:hypothetical protein